MKNSKVTISGITYDDNTPDFVFKSNKMFPKYLPFDKQVLDVENYSYDLSSDPMDEKDLLLTNSLRAKDNAYGRVFQMSKLKGSPMYSFQDSVAMMLPLDHQCKSDFLTYTDENYQQFIFDLCNDLMKVCVTQEEIDCVKMLMVDYSCCAPYASCIRHDGRMKISDSVWSDHNLEIFSKELNRFFSKEFKDAKSNLKELLPNLNVTKSCGFNTSYSDGRPFSKEDHYFVPKEYWTEIPNNIFRYDFSDLKLDWINSGRLRNNLKFFLEHCEEYDKPDVMLQAFEMQALSVHTEAYRGNNADVPLIDFDGDFRKSIGKFHKKDRVFSYEKDPGIFSSGRFDDQKLSSEFRKKNPKHIFTLLKKRPMFPAPNASFSVSFILLFRILLHRVEQSGTGFPSNRPIVLNGFDEFYRSTSEQGKCVISYDRSTCEQFITDNFNLVLRMFPDWLKRVIKGLGVGVCPSTYGPRVVSGGLFSGTAQTTFLNSIVGMFETINCISYLIDEKFENICPIYIEHIFTGDSNFCFKDFTFHVNLGTDDQVFLIAKENVTDDQLISALKPKIEKFCSERSLSGEACEKVTVFGLDISTTEVKVSQVLGLGKVFLMEKTTNGDACALKMYARLSLLPKYYEIISNNMLSHGFGNISTYKAGALNFKKILSNFGFPVEEFINVYSPVESLIMGSALTSMNVDPRTSSKLYPLDKMQELYSEFLNNFEQFSDFRNETF